MHEVLRESVSSAVTLKKIYTIAGLPKQTYAQRSTLPQDFFIAYFNFYNTTTSLALSR